MPHIRSRNALAPLKRLARLWPVVGLLGMRQTGKSTLLRDLLKISNFVTLDDDDVRSDASNAPKVFLAKYSRPLVIDEIQKEEKLFDALKSEVDKKRKPGTFYITGSLSFAAGDMTRESLTGRMGSIHLYPLTYREANDDESPPTLDRFVKCMQRGGMPVPMFLRDDESRRLYWDSWLETTLIRDLAKAYGKGYDLDFARIVLKEIGMHLSQGQYSEISLFSKDSRKVTKYLNAMANIFILNRIPCHEKGIGRDHWLVSDSGLANYLLGEKSKNENSTLSLARIYIYNEIASHYEYSLKKTQIFYFKSARGEPVDFVVNDLPIKIIVQSSGAKGWHEKGLLGAMKKLNCSRSILCAPIEKSDPVKKRGISRVSWLYFVNLK